MQLLKVKPQIMLTEIFARSVRAIYMIRYILHKKVMISAFQRKEVCQKNDIKAK